MMIETEIKVSYKTVLGDMFDSKISKRDLADIIDKHVQDYCKEHDICKENVEILRQKVISKK